MMNTIPGNKCGFERDTCREYVRPKIRHDGTPVGKPPALIWKAAEMAAVFFFFPYKYLKRLAKINGSSRQQKGERREAIAGTLQVLINYCDLATFNVLTYYKNAQGQSFCPMGFIADKLGYTVKRIQRAMKDLEKAAYVVIRREKIQVGEKFYQQNTISLTHRLFADLNLSNESIATSRHYKHKSNAKNGKVSPEMKKIAKELTKASLSPQLEAKSLQVKNANDCLAFLKEYQRA